MRQTVTAKECTPSSWPRNSLLRDYPKLEPLRMQFLTKSIQKRKMSDQAQALLGRADCGCGSGGMIRWFRRWALPVSSALLKQALCRWKKPNGGLEPSEVCELKQLREENTKRKRLVVDLMQVIAGHRTGRQERAQTQLNWTQSAFSSLTHR